MGVLNEDKESGVEWRLSQCQVLRPWSFFPLLAVWLLTDLPHVTYFQILPQGTSSFPVQKPFYKDTGMATVKVRAITCLSKEKDPTPENGHESVKMAL